MEGYTDLQMIIIIAPLIIGMIVVGIAAQKEGYKQGQIDAQNGKIKYKLTRNTDNEEVWKEVKPEAINRPTTNNK